MKIIITITMLLIAAIANAEVADKVLVNKSERMLYLQKGGVTFASYPVTFGSNPAGHKEKEGDGRTPEGTYMIDVKKEDSAYYKALHISYPNTKDVEKAKAKGVSPGGDIMVHGQKNGFGWAAFIVQHFNWTRGCIALSNEDMESIWKAVNAGTVIEIRP